MAGNKVYVQGSYVDVHDNQEVHLSIDKAGKVVVGPGQLAEAGELPESEVKERCMARDEELFHFIHPSVEDWQEWQVHDEVKRLVVRQGLQEICRHLLEMRKAGKVLLPQSPSTAYEELVRMGMPSGDGFNESTFRKYYRNK